MSLLILIVLTIIFAVLAIHASRLLNAALWLAGVSALVSLIFYLMGATQVAVIELSVGAGLVTILFVFAISIAGENEIETTTVLPKPLIWGLTALYVALLGIYLLPASLAGVPAVVEAPLAEVLWETRALDMLVQVVLIFCGVLGLLGILGESQAPITGTLADEMIARRERELAAMQQRAAGAGED
ncbi:MAG TPA: hypothetical protein DEH25_08125 [Chloroflexi bacterium]|nr:hypothetical protein [Chloroflexota bacterium]HBY06964.1 hypothetical protein [Chloroflexota bacterium]